MSYLEPWEELKGEKKREVLAGIHANDSLQNNPDALDMFEKQLPFFDNWSLIQIKIKADDGSFGCSHLVWCPAGRFQLLDWSANSIHTANGRAGLILNNDTVKDYLRFYCDFETDSKGPFTIIEDRNNSRFDGVDLSKVECLIDLGKDGSAIEPGQEELWSQLHPVKISLDDNIYIADTFYWHDKTLYRAKMQVELNGAVSILDKMEYMRLPSAGTTVWHETSY